MRDTVSPTNWSGVTAIVSILILAGTALGFGGRILMKIGQLLGKVENIDTSVTALHGKHEQHAQRFDHLDRRVTRIEGRLQLEGGEVVATITPKRRANEI